MPKKTVTKKRIPVKEQEVIEIPTFDIDEETKPSMNFSALRWLLIIATIGLFLLGGFVFISLSVLTALALVASLIFEDQIRAFLE